MTQLRIRRVDLGSLFRHGCLLGVALAALPCLPCGLVLLWAFRLIQRWLESWQVIPFELLGQEIARIDLVHVLGLERLVEALHLVTTVSPLVVLLSGAWLAVAVGLLLGVAGLLLGLAYNGLASFTGGVVVEASARPVRGRRPNGV